MDKKNIANKNLTKAPLIEAVCEFRFKSENWDPTIPGILYPLIKEEFPEKESVQESTVHFSLDTRTQEKPKISSSDNEFPKFSNIEKNIFSIFKKNIVSIHCIKPYSGWEDFLKKILFIFDKYYTTAKPEKLERIGLRYVNKILLPKEDFKFLEYFNIKASPLEDTINNEDIINMQTGVISKDNINLVKTQFIWIGNNNEKMEFILDIDYSNNTDTPKDDKISDWLDTAHNKIEDIFIKSFNPKGLSIFE